MFYYPAVLNRHSGCFSTIWLVATKGIRVPRRDFLKVNVQNTCEDLMQYVLERVPPPRPGLPQPRFSLYLSSQLQYGVIMVFHRQCAILLEEIHTIVGQLLKRMASQNIDLDDPTRQALMLPDALSLLEETEGAQDPLFGVMSMQDIMPSPTTLMQMDDTYAGAAFPEHLGITSPSDSVAVEKGITASPDSITLRETEPVTIPTAEFEGVELVDQLSDVLDLLMAQTDHFPEDVDVVRKVVTPGQQEREIERGVYRERETAKEITGSTAELQPDILPSEEAMLLPQEVPGVSVEKPVPFPDQVTPVSLPVLPSPPPAVRQQETRRLELEEVSPPEVRRRRKRQLIFFDPETQLPQEMLQQQIDDPLTETRPVHLIPPSAQRTHSPAELLNNPCTFLPEEVLSLWQRAATVTSVADSDLTVGERGPESTDSEKEREREMVEAAEKEEERRERSPREVPRDLTDSEFSGLMLDGSDQKELSREISPVFTSDREGPIVSKSLSVMQDIPEVEDEFPMLFPSDSESAPVLFHSLLPPDVDRKTVSTAFQGLLENVSARTLRVKQDEPYGDILILPGL
ncbi:meiotic recombination protein REC8-like [Solea senegalensis]|uniref:Meiotic recombination protein REC8-like n=2 Tax=Solea senegalensis TaxID=28829 RepID=A0AAV6PMR1_SOLSE|nr:meiotic recombination protein REC8-like [Solea senegalensis]